MIDTSSERQDLADQLEAVGAIRTPAWRKAVEAVPRELFLAPGVFLPAGVGVWRPVVAADTDQAEWIRTAYTNESLVTQLDNHLTADQAQGPVEGLPTSSSTVPALVLEMIEELEVEDGHQGLDPEPAAGHGRPDERGHVGPADPERGPGQHRERDPVLGARVPGEEHRHEHEMGAHPFGSGGDLGRDAEPVRGSASGSHSIVSPRGAAEPGAVRRIRA